MDELKPHSTCLGVAVDSRIIEVLHESFQVISSTGLSRHLELQEDFGKLVTDDNDKLGLANFLAQPSTKGGLAFLLLQPGFTHKYDTGSEAVVDTCKSLSALQDVIKFCTAGKWGIKDYTVFDSLPFLDSRELTAVRKHESRACFREILQEKAPDVVLCMWKDDEEIFGVENLRSEGIGKKFQVERCKIGSKTCTRVNAFHPSYMMNFSCYDSCFRQLFILEVAHAFGVLHGTWQNQPWMDELRYHCRSLAISRSQERKFRNTTDRLIHRVVSNIHLLKSFTGQLVTIHDRDRNDSEVRNVLDLCNDTSLLLVDLESEVHLQPFAGLTSIEYATKSLLAQLKREHFYDWIFNRGIGSTGFYTRSTYSRAYPSERAIDVFFETLNEAFKNVATSSRNRTQIIHRFDLATVIKAFAAFATRVEQSFPRNNVVADTAPYLSQQPAKENSNALNLLSSQLARLNLQAPTQPKSVEPITVELEPFDVLTRRTVA